MNAGDVIKRRRKAMGLSQLELAEKLGYSDRSSIAKIESGKALLNEQKLEKFAKVLDIPMSELLGFDIHSLYKSISDNIPKIVQKTDEDNPINDDSFEMDVLGSIACGNPIEAENDVIGLIPIFNRMKNDRYIALRLKGDSMEPQFRSGDDVIIKKDEDIKNGDVIVALVQSKKDALCKVFQKSEAGVFLMSYNPTYEPIFIPVDRIEEDLCIIGKVIEVRRYI